MAHDEAPVFPNHTLARLREGGRACGLGMRLTRSADMALIARTCGYDWLFIDMEHTSLGLDEVAQIAIAALPIGITPLVRVPGLAHHHASRALDAGAQGIVAPHVETAQEAAAVVAACKYPPVGHRALVGTLPHLAFRHAPLSAATRAINEQTLVAVMIETPRGLDNLEAIAAVPGLDVVMIGTNDLCAELGLHGQFDHPRVGEIYDRLVAACRLHGVHPGMGGVYDEPLMRAYIGRGVRFVLSGNDLRFLMQGAGARASFLAALPASAQG